MKLKSIFFLTSLLFFSGYLQAQLCVNTDSTFSVISCDSYTVPSGNATYTSSGTVRDTVLNSSGCDSLMTIFLTINNSTTSSISVSACNQYISPSGATRTTGGTFNDTIPNSRGCDSVITINLTLDTTTYGNISAVACDSYTAPSGAVFNSTGTYIDTLTNAAGCDSLLSISLVVNNSNSGTLTVSSCLSYTTPRGNATYTTSGQYFDTLTTAQGCDSLLRIVLTITTNSSSTVNAMACDQYVSPSGNYTWTGDGTYFDTIPNSAGCDSFITFIIDIDSSTTSSITESACNSYTSPSGLHTWMSSGTYRDTLSNAVGCDSIITINLTIDTTTYANIPLIVCDSYTSPSGNYIWTTNGTYHDTIANAAGCDSVMTFVLVFNQSTTGSVVDTACVSYTSPSGNFTWFSSGTYQDTIANAAGCDSAITIELTIKTVDTAVTMTGPATITAIASPASFQWVDCDSSYTPISGAVGPNFSPTVNGNYAVEVTQDGCTQTSACVPITTVGFEDLPKANDFKLLPNPTDGRFEVKLGGVFGQVTFTLENSLGQVISTEVLQSVDEHQLEIVGDSGVYLLHVQTDTGEQVSFRIVKH